MIVPAAGGTETVRTLRRWHTFVTDIAPEAEIVVVVPSAMGHLAWQEDQAPVARGQLGRYTDHPVGQEPDRQANG